MTTLVVPPPSYREGGPLGPLRAFQRDPLAFLTRLRDVGSSAVRVRFGPRQAVFLLHPELAGRVLVDNARNYGKQTRGYAMLRKVLGHGLLTSEGDPWKAHRRISQPAFNRRRVAEFGDVMVRIARDRMADTWSSAAQRGGALNVADEMMRMTLQVVSETLLSIRVGDEADVVAQALPVVLEHVLYRTTHPLSLPELVPTPRNRHYRRALAALDQLVAGIVRKRRRGEVPAQPDLLQLLLGETDSETGARLDDQQLRDEVMTIYLAGHETTALALTWTFFELSNHPQWAARVRAEVDTVLAGRAAGAADMNRLEVTRAVIEEAMRLHPPVWLLARLANQADVVGGHHIDPGMLVFVSPWIIHRHRESFADAERFDPERFFPGRRETIPKHAYIPFSAGQRKCIGDHFALLEAVMILATVLQRFELQRVPDRAVEPHCAITLRPRDGLWMTATARSELGARRAASPEPR
jgi:cytochrome P450